MRGATPALFEAHESGKEFGSVVVPLTVSPPSR